MSDWQTLLFLIAGALLVWVCVRMIRNNPHAFSSKALGKSIYTLGWLTLLLIAIIAIGVLILRKLS